MMHDETSKKLINEILDMTTFKLIDCRLTRIEKNLTYRIQSPFSRILLGVRGGNRYKMSGRWVELSPGTALLIPTGTLVDCENRSGAELYWMYMRVDYAGCVDLFQLVQIPEYRLSLGNAAKFFRCLIKEFNTPGVSHRLQGISCLLEMLIPFFRNAVVSLKDGRFPQLQQLLPAIRYIDSHIGQRLTLSELAATVYLSPNYFCNVFSSAMGISPIAYINQRRITYAKEYLLLTTLPVQKIAPMVGIENPFYFSNLFRKLVNLSPLQYRRLQQALHESPPINALRG